MGDVTLTWHRGKRIAGGLFVDEVVNLAVKRRSSGRWRVHVCQQNHAANYLCNQTDLFLKIFTAYKYHKLSSFFFTVIINVENRNNKSLAGCLETHYEQKLTFRKQQPTKCAKKNKKETSCYGGLLMKSLGGTWERSGEGLWGGQASVWNRGNHRQHHRQRGQHPLPESDEKGRLREKEANSKISDVSEARHER